MNLPGISFSARAVLAFIALMAGPALGAQSIADSPGRGLSPGDKIVISVWRNAELSCECIVAGDGTVIHPLYREVTVTGVSLTVAEDRLRTFLSRYAQTPQFVIQPLVRIIVGGEIRSPNVYSVPPETTIAQAVALAGGPTERGRLEKIRIIRDRQEINIDLNRSDSDAALLQIRSGDQIMIGRRGTTAREVIAPVASTVAAIASIVGLFLRF